MSDLKNSLALTRERRSNAGANMSRLLDKEEDDFYKTSYGGFVEIEDDNDFSLSDSSDSENVIDSDFDIDENADADSDDEEKAIEEETRMKKKRSIPMATFTKSTISKVDPKSSTKTKDIASNRKSRQSRSNKIVDKKSTDNMYKNLRESTKKHSKTTRQNLDERQKRLKSKKKFLRHYYREPTQEERLEEAKKTELENMRSLQAYKNLEIEKSKLNNIKRKVNNNGRMIRYHSYTQLIEGEDGRLEPCYRKIIEFPSQEDFENNFSRYNKKQEIRSRGVSMLSNLPNRYRDPLTEFPFALAKEFGFIRDAYVRFLEQCCKIDNVSVKRFMDANRMVKSIQVKINSIPNVSSKLTNTTTVHFVPKDLIETSRIPIFKQSKDSKNFSIIVLSSSSKSKQSSTPTTIKLIASSKINPSGGDQQTN
ncbi:Alanine-glyoxylate aminotransferase 2 [Sarcoptes scabiei]|nr:Alanine-glyoxylate aminotransferase 2 [Sarcoptes scabiei]